MNVSLKCHLKSSTMYLSQSDISRSNVSNTELYCLTIEGLLKIFALEKHFALDDSFDR